MRLGLWHKSNSLSSLSSCWPLSPFKMDAHELEFGSPVSYYRLIAFITSSSTPEKIKKSHISSPSLHSLHQFLLIDLLIITKQEPAPTRNKTESAHNQSGVSTQGNCFGEDLFLSSSSSLPPSFLFSRLPVSIWWAFPTLTNVRFII